MHSDGEIANGHQIGEIPDRPGHVGNGENDVCIDERECETDAESDGGFLCNGVENCDEDNDVCVSSGNPCLSPEVCDDETDLSSWNFTEASHLMELPGNLFSHIHSLTDRGRKHLPSHRYSRQPDKVVWCCSQFFHTLACTLLNQRYSL